MGNDFQQEVETLELVDRLLRKIFQVTEERQREQQNFEILLTINPDALMKIKAYSHPTVFSLHPNRTIHGWPYLADAEQKEPYKVWSKHL